MICGLTKHGRFNVPQGMCVCVGGGSVTSRYHISKGLIASCNSVTHFDQAPPVPAKQHQPCLIKRSCSDSGLFTPTTEKQNFRDALRHRVRSLLPDLQRVSPLSAGAPLQAHLLRELPPGYEPPAAAGDEPVNRLSSVPTHHQPVRRAQH